MTIEVMLPIDPAAMPSAQHKGIGPDGRVYTKSAVRRMRWIIVNSVRAMVPRKVAAAAWELPKDQPWHVAIVYTYRLAGTPKRLQGKPKTTRPDVDNLTKLVLDALTSAGVAWKDDAQVAELLTSKRHADRGEEANIYVEISPIINTNPEGEDNE